MWLENRTRPLLFAVQIPRWSKRIRWILDHEWELQFNHSRKIRPCSVPVMESSMLTLRSSFIGGLMNPFRNVFLTALQLPVISLDLEPRSRIFCRTTPLRQEADSFRRSGSYHRQS